MRFTESWTLWLVLVTAVFATSRLVSPASTEPSASFMLLADEPSLNEGTPEPDQGDKDAETPPYRRAAPPAAAERADERHEMVEQQIKRRRVGSLQVDDEDVLEAMRTVPRHVFIPLARRSQSYRDTPLPIGYGQTISQPYIVALMTQLLDLTPESRVLEIGTGSGYQAAVLAHLTPNVFTVEIIESLATRASTAFRDQGYREINARCADGYHGWKEEAPFDAIIVTCASGHLPPPLWDQLKPGGRIVIPIGGVYEVQRLVVVMKDQDGGRSSRTITSVRFVPLTRGDAP